MKTRYNLPKKTATPIYLFICFFLLTFVLYGQTTSIPDPKFEQALIDQGIDSDGTINGQVLTSDINSLTELDVSISQIEDLTGIEDFTALENLDASSNPFESLDFSSNIYLKKLNLDENDYLSSLNISNNLDLESLSCSFSPLLNELDVTNNILLKELLLGAESSTFMTNEIETLDLSANTSLEKLLLVNMANLRRINLKSGTNGLLTDVLISCELDLGADCGPNPCAVVDNVTAAQNNEPPYAMWNALLNYSEDCWLGLPTRGQWAISLYPNPAKDKLFLSSKDQNGTLSTKIFSIQGKLLNAQSIDFKNETSIDVSQLTSGIYFLNIKDENGRTEVQKFVKE